MRQANLCHDAVARDVQGRTADLTPLLAEAVPEAFTAYDCRTCDAVGMSHEQSQAGCPVKLVLTTGRLHHYEVIRFDKWDDLSDIERQKWETRANFEDAGCPDYARCELCGKQETPDVAQSDASECAEATHLVEKWQVRDHDFQSTNGTLGCGHCTTEFEKRHLNGLSLDDLELAALCMPRTPVHVVNRHGECLVCWEKNPPHPLCRGNA